MPQRPQGAKNQMENIPLALTEQATAAINTIAFRDTAKAATPVDCANARATAGGQGVGVEPGCPANACVDQRDEQARQTCVIALQVVLKIEPQAARPSWSSQSTPRHDRPKQLAVVKRRRAQVDAAARSQQFITLRAHGPVEQRQVAAHRQHDIDLHTAQCGRLQRAEHHFVGQRNRE